MHVSETDLKSFILDSGLVSRKDVESAEAKVNEGAKGGGQSMGDVLVSEGLLSSDALRRIQAYVLGIPFVNLKDSLPVNLLVVWQRRWFPISSIPWRRVLVQRFISKYTDKIITT